jgi:hypothetical protein
LLREYRCKTFPKCFIVEHISAALLRPKEDVAGNKKVTGE